MKTKWTPLRAGGLCGLLMACTLLAASCARVLGTVDVVERPLLPDAGMPVPAPGAVGSAGGTPSSGPEICEAPGQLHCDGQWLEVCVSFTGTEPTWVHLQDCQTPEGCQETPNPHCAGLAQRLCTPGESQCDGATPRVCNAAGDGWTTLPACMSAAHCSTSASSCNGAAPCCLAAPCQAGEMRCNQGQMQRCNSDATDWETQDTCATPDLCLAGLNSCGGSGASCACRTAPCQENESRCTGTGLERCNAGRTDWELVGQCETAALCEVGRSAVPPVCAPPECEIGSHICTPEGVLKGCRIDRTGYDTQQTCDGPQFCDPVAGKCNPVECEAGDKRCNGAQIEVCLEDRTGFRPEGDPCLTPQLCNDSDPSSVRCDPPKCAVNQFSCFGTAQLQTCNAGRTGFQPVGATCLRPDLCSEVRGRCDFCFPGRQECTPLLDASRVCSLTGNFFGPETPCPLGCNSPTGQCITCAIGSYRCNGGIIARCNDGRSFTPLNRANDCSGPTQFSCSTFGQLTQTGCGANGCNTTRGLCNECAGTQRVCSGASSFRQCSGGTLGATQACGDGLACSGAGNCGCNPGTPRCNGDSLEFCNGVGTGFVDGDRCQDDVLLVCDDGGLTRVQCSSSDDCEQADGASCD